MSRCRSSVRDIIQISTLEEFLRVLKQASKQASKQADALRVYFPIYTPRTIYRSVYLIKSRLHCRVTAKCSTFVLTRTTSSPR